jgi:hypothetical protein
MKIQPFQIQAASLGRGRYLWTYTASNGKEYSREDNDSQAYDRINRIKIDGPARGDAKFIGELASSIKFASKH